MSKLYIPKNYSPVLNVKETEKAIILIKDFFQLCLSTELNLTRVTAPLFVEAGTGINDDLTGVMTAFNVPKYLSDNDIRFENTEVAAVLTGTFVLERIFAIPGMGKYYVQSVYDLDYTMVLGMTVFYGAFLVLANLIVDILYGIIDPRIKLAESHSRGDDEEEEEAA